MPQLAMNNLSQHTGSASLAPVSILNVTWAGPERCLWMWSKLVCRRGTLRLEDLHRRPISGQARHLLAFSSRGKHCKLYNAVGKANTLKITKIEKNFDQPFSVRDPWRTISHSAWLEGVTEKDKGDDKQNLFMSHKESLHKGFSRCFLQKSVMLCSNRKEPDILAFGFASGWVERKEEWPAAPDEARCVWSSNWLG